MLRVRECAVQRQTVPLAVKALKAAVQELMVMAEQKEGGGEDDGSDDSDVDEYQDDMKALMVRHRLFLVFQRKCNTALLAGLCRAQAEMGADPSTGGWLMDQLLDDHLDEEEEEDPDCVNDPLYQLDLKVTTLFPLPRFLCESTAHAPTHGVADDVWGSFWGRRSWRDS